MAETIHKKQAWLDEMAAIVQKDINTLEVLQRARNLIRRKLISYNYVVLTCTYTKWLNSRIFKSCTE